VSSMLAGEFACHSRRSTSASEPRAFAYAIKDDANGSKRRQLHFEWKRPGWLSRSGQLSSSAAETEMRLKSHISGRQTLTMGQHAAIVPRYSQTLAATSRLRVLLPTFACLHRRDTTLEGEFQSQLHQAGIIDG
jgi:hypothetical protein